MEHIVLGMTFVFSCILFSVMFIAIFMLVLCATCHKGKTVQLLYMRFMEREAWRTYCEALKYIESGKNIPVVGVYESIVDREKVTETDPFYFKVFPIVFKAPKQDKNVVFGEDIDVALYDQHNRIVLSGFFDRACMDLIERMGMTKESLREISDRSEAMHAADQARACKFVESSQQ